MFWKNRGESTNVSMRTGLGRTGLVVGGGGGLVLLALSLLFGVDLTQLGSDGPGKLTEVASQDLEATLTPAQKELSSFTKVVLHDTEVVWGEQFRKMGKQYREPKMVIYDGSVRSACGTTGSAVGPFYCPGDETIYIDLAFYRDMETKLDAAGDFARAYVIAHEVGHHVQKLLGYGRQAGFSPDNKASVRIELQADFLAGVWAHQAQKEFQFLEPGDIDEALNAAFQVGDDRLQERSRGFVVPDSFTHGSSKDREASFREGFDTGDVKRADRYVSEAG